MPRLVADEVHGGLVAEADWVVEALGVHSSSSTSSAPPRPGRPRQRARRGPLRRTARRAASPSSSPRGRRAAAARVTCRPGSTSTLMTVPGIGAVTRRLLGRRAAVVRGIVDARHRRGGGGGRLSRHAPRQAGRRARRRVLGERRMLGEECSRRRARRGRADARRASAGTAGSSSRRRPPSRAARLRARSNASSRVAPYAISFAIIGSYECRSRRPPRRPRRRGSTSGSRSRSIAPRLRQERPRILGVEPHLDRVPVQVTSVTSSAPSAMRSCSRTRSTPVTSSVTGCSTWMRAFSSRK